VVYVEQSRQVVLLAGFTDFWSLASRNLKRLIPATYVDARQRTWRQSGRAAL